MEQVPFDAAAEQLMTDLPTFCAQANALAEGMNAVAAGGAFSLQYTVSTTTTDSDPGPGVLRFNTASQSSAGTLRVDLVDAAGRDATSLFADFTASTSAVKGHIRLAKMNDPTKWLLFSVAALASPTGYKNITVTLISASAANPFANGDSIALHFQRTGDKGDTGATGVSGLPNLVVLTTTQAWVVPVGVTKLDVTVVDGGFGGEGTSGSPSTAGAGGRGGHGGGTVITVAPGVSCTATIGAGGAAVGTGGPSTGGSTTFSGSGFTTITSANATLKVPGGGTGFYANNVRAGNGGGSMLAPPSSTGYGAGGAGGYANSSVAGQAGVVIIRY